MFPYEGLTINKYKSSWAIKCYCDNSAAFRIPGYILRSTQQNNSRDIKQCSHLYNNLCFIYKSAFRRIANHKGKFIKCHVNDKFSRGRVQTNSNDTENVMSHLGYISIWKRYCEIWKGKYTETITHTSLQTRTPYMSQHILIISQWTNQTNFMGWAFMLATSWKKPSDMDLKPKLDKQKIELFPVQVQKTNKCETKHENLFKVCRLAVWIK